MSSASVMLQLVQRRAWAYNLDLKTPGQLGACKAISASV